MTDLSNGRGWLTAPAAASVARIDRALGHPMQITEAGRSYERQNEHYQAYRRYLAGGPWAPIALSPKAPSIHQLGNAIDSDEAQRHITLMAEHGWIRTVYRGGKLVEPWHFEYFIGSDQHRNETIQGDDMGTLDPTEANYQTFAAFLQRAFQYDVRPSGFGPRWELGPTIWERLTATETAAKAGVSIDPAEVAAAIAAAIPDDLAAGVVDELAKRLAG